MRVRLKERGIAPGSLIYTGRFTKQKTKIEIIDYMGQRFEEKVAKNIEDCFEYKDKKSVTWINVMGLNDIDVIQKIGEEFGLHPLIQEDILNVNQRPKIEEFENFIYIVLKMASFNKSSAEIEMEQVSLILAPNYVISFQENEGDVFDPIRERIRKDKGKIRKEGCDYLIYTLIDAIMDNYFVILENIGDKIEDMEEELILRDNTESLGSIHKLKRDLILLRKSIWPLREAVNALQRLETELIKDSTDIYLRDVYDHSVQLIDTIETYRDMVSGLHDTYLSVISNRMNEVMKVLTIISTIFIPLTFITGLYGMNFEHMPELAWEYSYYVVWLVIVIVAVSMLVYFQRRKWL